MRFPEPFLAAHGFGAAAREPLPADASHRRYARLRGGPRPALLMDAPPPEDVRPFADLARHLLAAGLSVPEILAEDAAAVPMGRLGTPEEFAMLVVFIASPAAYYVMGVTFQVHGGAVMGLP